MSSNVVVGDLLFSKIDHLNEYQVGNGQNGSGLVNDVEYVEIPSHINVQGIKYKVTQISSYCFKRKSCLKSVSLPHTIRKISVDSFWRTNISHLFIPNSVTTLSSYAFSSMLSLETIVFEKGIKLTQTGSYLFLTCYTKYTIFYCSDIDMSHLEYCFLGNTTLPDIYVLNTYPADTFGGQNVIHYNSGFCRTGYSEHINTPKISIFRSMNPFLFLLYFFL